MKGVGCGVRSAARRRCEDKPGGDYRAWLVKRAPLTYGSGEGSVASEQPPGGDGSGARRIRSRSAAGCCTCSSINRSKTHSPLSRQGQGLAGLVKRITGSPRVDSPSPPPGRSLIIASDLFPQPSMSVTATPVRPLAISRAIATRRPQRITITVPWSLYNALVQASDLQGRSLSNLACYWLEQQSTAQE